MTAKTRLVTLVVAMSACASAPTEERALVFSGRAMPACAFEIVEEISVQASVRGDRRVAEAALHRALARAADRREAHGVIGVDIKPPDRLPVVVARRGEPPPEQPPVAWSATAQAIRFTDPTCMR